MAPVHAYSSAPTPPIDMKSFDKFLESNAVEDGEYVSSSHPVRPNNDIKAALPFLGCFVKSYAAKADFVNQRNPADESSAIHFPKRDDRTSLKIIKNRFKSNALKG